MILDFWNTKLNPITMQSREVDAMYSAEKYNKKAASKKKHTYIHEDLSLNDLYISSKDAQENTGLTAKKIKESVGAGFLSKTGIHFYKKSDIENIVFESKANVTVKKVPEIPEEYISSTELKKILNITTMQLFTLSKKEGWRKKKFVGPGNIRYYLKSQVLK